MLTLAQATDDIAAIIKALQEVVRKPSRRITKAGASRQSGRLAEEGSEGCEGSSRHNETAKSSVASVPDEQLSAGSTSDGGGYDRDTGQAGRRRHRRADQSAQEDP